MRNNNIQALAKIADPKEFRRKVLGDLSDALSKLEIFTNRVMCVTYVTPERTASGLYLPETNIAEAEYQGKAGLVVKVGPIAFQDDEHTKFGGVKIDVGDWVWYRVSDAMPTLVRGYPCRIIPDVQIIGRLETPEIIW